MIIWGLYMGDDFENAFSLTYGLDYWKDLRIFRRRKSKRTFWEGPPTDTAAEKIRVLAVSTLRHLSTSVPRGFLAAG